MVASRRGAAWAPLQVSARWPCTHCRPRHSPRPYASLLRSGSPAAPDKHRLPLLPSGPGGVHGSPPRRTRPSTPLDVDLTEKHRASSGSSTPLERVAGYSAPLARHLARPPKVYRCAAELSYEGARNNCRRRGRDSNPRGRLTLRDFQSRALGQTMRPLRAAVVPGSEVLGPSCGTARNSEPGTRNSSRRRGWDSNPRGLFTPYPFSRRAH
jgi:hypothetical protein